MTPRISIIIPMYNVEKYIEKCIYSVINNNWRADEYEMVLVDDESPDSSLAIAKKITKNLSNVKIISQKNLGLGGARNTGIKAAIGNFLFFLDSDDFLIPNKILEVLNLAENENLDVLEFAANRVNVNGQIIDEIFKINCKYPIDGEQYIGTYNFANSACNKLYKRQFLIANEIFFIEKVYVEDAPFNVEVLMKAKKVRGIENVVVSFLQNNHSITRHTRTGAQLEKFIKDGIIVTNKINSIAKNNFISNTAKSALHQKVSVFVSGIILMIIQSKKPFYLKKADIKDLVELDLYPIKNNSKIFVRDLFIMIVNIRFILNTILFLTSFNSNKK
jgi:glycosyltransferase involved in cell wall biosynthesis